MCPLVASQSYAACAAGFYSPSGASCICTRPGSRPRALKRTVLTPVSVAVRKLVFSEMHSLPVWLLQRGAGVPLQHVHVQPCQQRQRIHVHVQRRLRHVRLRLHPRVHRSVRASMFGLTKNALTGPNEGMIRACCTPMRTACTANQYNAVAGGSCTACPTGSTSSSGATTCACSPGYSTAGTGASLVCTGMCFPSHAPSRSTNFARVC